MKILKWVRDRNIISLNLAGTVAIRVQGLYWGVSWGVSEKGMGIRHGRICCTSFTLYSVRSIAQEDCSL